MAGRQIDAGGVFRVMAGVPQTAVLHLTDDDIMFDQPVEIQAKRPRNELLNAINGTFSDPAQKYEPIALPPRAATADVTADGARLEGAVDLLSVTSKSQAQRIMEIERRSARQQMRVTLTARARCAVLEAGDWVTWTSARHGWVNKTFRVENAPLAPDFTVSLALTETNASVYAWGTNDELDIGQSAALNGGPSTLTQLQGLALQAIEVEASSGNKRPGLRATWTAPNDWSVDDIKFQYRIVGRVDVLDVTALDAEAGSYAWVNGVQPEQTYECRALLVTRPRRSTTWTPWVQMSGTTGLIVGIDAGPIDANNLDPQTRFEIGLATAVDETLGPAGLTLPEWVAALERAQQQAAEATIEALLDTEERRREIIAQATTIEGVRAEVASEAVARASADSALASQIGTVSTTLNGVSTTVTTLSQSVDGITGRWGVAIDTNGAVTGLVQLSGTSGESTFDIVVNKFRVQTTDGQTIVPVFQIGNVDGTPTIVLRGNMIADGDIEARHISVSSLDAISGDFGQVTAGRISGAKYYNNLDTGEMWIEA